MFESHQPNIENMQQYLSESQSSDGPRWWSIPAGSSSVRILPPWDPTGRVSLPVFMHPIEYKGEGMAYTKYNWTCVNKTFNKPCPICDGLTALSASGVDISNWEANRRQFYFNAIIMYDPTHNQQKNTGTAPGTHVLMKAPKTFYDWIISQITNPMIGDITSVTNGIDILVTKEGQGLGTSYNMTLSPNGRTAIPPEYLDKISSLYNLDEIFSAGFDQNQINDLVNHLKNSAGAMANNIPQMQQQMAGYQNYMPPQQVPNQFYQQYQTNSNQNPAAQQPNIPAQPPAHQFPQPPAFNPAPMAAPQFPPQTITPPVQVPTTPTNPTSQPDTSNNNNLASSNKPKCYGQYDSGNVNCVVCPFEIPCSHNK